VDLTGVYNHLWDRLTWDFIVGQMTLKVVSSKETKLERACYDNNTRSYHLHLILFISIRGCGYFKKSSKSHAYQYDVFYKVLAPQLVDYFPFIQM
jgi:hypothetical protein